MTREYPRATLYMLLELFRERRSVMNNERTTIGWGFWIVWVLASVIGFGMGSFIGMGASYALLPAMGITKEFGIAHLVC
jgi:hypothetical protein